MVLTNLRNSFGKSWKREPSKGKWYRKFSRLNGHLEKFLLNLDLVVDVRVLCQNYLLEISLVPEFKVLTYPDHELLHLFFLGLTLHHSSVVTLLARDAGSFLVALLARKPRPFLCRWNA